HRVGHPRAGRRREDAHGRSARVPGRRGVHARPGSGRGARGAVRRGEGGLMATQGELPLGADDIPFVRTAEDLPAAFAAGPAAWRCVLSGWTPGAQQAVVDAVRAVSDGREIAPPDPFRALRMLAPDEVKVVVFGQDPYPRAGHATGLAFSAGHGKPVSL